MNQKVIDVFKSIDTEDLDAYFTARKMKTKYVMSQKFEEAGMCRDIEKYIQIKYNIDEQLLPYSVYAYVNEPEVLSIIQSILREEKINNIINL